MNYDLLKIIIPVLGVALGHLLWFTRKLNTNSVCVNDLAKKIDVNNINLSEKIDETKNLIERNYKKLDERVDKFEKKVFEDGKPKFVYNDDCKRNHEDILRTFEKCIGELKTEFIKRDDLRMEAHRTLHNRLNEQQKELIELRCIIKEMKK